MASVQRYAYHIGHVLYIRRPWTNFSHTVHCTHAAVQVTCSSSLVACVVRRLRPLRSRASHPTRWFLLSTHTLPKLYNAGLSTFVLTTGFVEEEQGFRFSHCSISSAKNSQIWTIVNTRSQLGFDHVPLLIASFFVLWCVIYL